MSHDPETQPTPEGGASVRAARRWLERALWLVAFVTLVWVGLAWSEARFYQRSHGHDIDSRNAELQELHEEADLGVRGARLPEGSAVARLRIPRLSVSVVVAEGTSPRTLRRAPGHLRGSALPGSGGNVAIAGHRDGFFRPLEDIRPGDEIVLETASGTWSYRVEWTKVVEPFRTEVVEDVGRPALTLITCYPFRYIGNAPLRFVVRGRLQDGPAGAASG